MIWESHYWKDDLKRQAKWLRSRRRKATWADGSVARLEKSVMLGFYAIRKLAEAAKISNVNVSREIQITAFPWSGKVVTRLNWHRIDELYDFESIQALTVDTIFLCHQFVHSYVFCPLFDEQGGLKGIYFTSDRYRNDRLHCITVEQIIELFRQIGNDYPSEQRWNFNNDKQDYEVTST